MDEIKIPEQRFNDLIAHEAKAEELYEKAIIFLVKQWQDLKKKKYNWNDDKTEVADYVNDELNRMEIRLKDGDGVWFNSQGTGTMMYWGFRGSKEILLVNKILEK